MKQLSNEDEARIPPQTAFNISHMETVMEPGILELFQPNDQGSGHLSGESKNVGRPIGVLKQRLVRG